VPVAPGDDTLQKGEKMATTTFKVLQIKTEVATQVVIRDRTGKKLFNLYLSGISVAVAVPSDAEIRIDPKEQKP
jgi:hypothetical protein